MCIYVPGIIQSALYGLTHKLFRTIPPKQVLLLSTFHRWRNREQSSLVTCPKSHTPLESGGAGLPHPRSQVVWVYSQNSWLPSFFRSCSVLLSHWNVTEASLLSATTPPSMDRLSWGPKVTVLPFQSPPSACHPHCRLPTSVP